jgi:hypothetical protein
MKPSILTDEYRLGVEFEVLNERITNAVAYHNAQRYEVGKDTALGNLHFDSMKALERLRSTMKAHDPNSITAAASALEAMKADRAHLEASKQSAAPERQSMMREQGGSFALDSTPAIA